MRQVREDAGPLDAQRILQRVEDALQANRSSSALTDLRRLAKLGVSSSYALLGLLYELGTETDPPRPDLAFKWYAKAAFEMGEREGYFALGRFYSAGVHVDKNMARALEYFERAFQEGMPEAAIHLGHIYLYGEGVAPDLTRAEAYLRKAQEAGYVLGAAMLAQAQLRQGRILLSVKTFLRALWKGKDILLADPHSVKLYGLHSELHAPSKPASR